GLPARARRPAASIPALWGASRAALAPAPRTELPRGPPQAAGPRPAWPGGAFSACCLQELLYSVEKSAFGPAPHMQCSVLRASRCPTRDPSYLVPGPTCKRQNALAPPWGRAKLPSESRGILHKSVKNYHSKIGRSAFRHGQRPLRRKAGVRLPPRARTGFPTWRWQPQGSTPAAGSLIRLPPASDAGISCATRGGGFDNGLVRQTAKAHIEHLARRCRDPGRPDRFRPGIGEGRHAVRRAPRTLAPGMRWVRRLRLEMVTSSA